MALRPLILFALAFALGSLLASARGDDFRMETKVYVGSDEAPAIETLTLFSGDVVYDFVLGNQPERIDSKLVTQFDMRNGKIRLLDGAREIQSTMSTLLLMDFTGAIRKRSA